jgi:hypothetical protein
MNNAIILIVGLTIGNFLWKATTNKNWGEAAKISFFQACAIGAYLLMSK